MIFWLMNYSIRLELYINYYNVILYNSLLVIIIHDMI